MRAWIGVDPGGQWTGVTSRLGHDCPRHKVLANPNPPMAAQGYLLDVLGEIAAQHQALTLLGALDVQVAVETVTAPCGRDRTGKVHPIDPRWLIGAATVLGAVLAAFRDVVPVEPGHNGRGALATYPMVLVSDGERRGHGWQLRAAGTSAQVSHARSAWDVTLRAAQILRAGAWG